MRNRGTTFALAIGAVAAVLVALPYKPFELDRYFVPKELVLNVVALLLCVVLIRRRRELRFDLADGLLALFLLWSAASAIFAANHWLAQRALGVSVAGAIVFWTARRVSAEDAPRMLLGAAAVAAVCAAATALLQTYGVESDWFTTSRMPGGTLGNRNFIAHVVAIGLPSLVWCTVTTRRPITALLGSLGAAILAASLVLTRSRAAWLAVAACVIALAGPVIMARKYWGRGIVGGRFARLLLAAFVGAAAAIVLPNRLNWNSETPYLDSARGMVDYSKGSGRGRLAQYENSMKMAAAYPVFGVGPGNWPVKYAKFAPSGDRSMTEVGITANPWPSSDWVAFASERGFVAAAALMAMLAVLFFGAFRGWRQFASGETVLLKLTLAGTIIATVVVGALDVSLLLAAPAFIAWMVLGAASGNLRATRELAVSSRTLTIGSVLAILIVAASTIRSAGQVMAMTSVGQGGHTAGWAQGAAWDPGSYRINLRAADLFANRGKCDASRKYALRAAALLPSSPEAKRALRRCQ